MNANWHWCKESRRGIRHGRAWLTLGRWKWHTEWLWFTSSCGLHLEVGPDSDYQIMGHIAIPWIISIYVGVDSPWFFNKMPRKRREFWLYVQDWTVRLIPWGRSMEWHSKDPWWIRGVTLDLRDLLLGLEKCHREESLESERLFIHLDGNCYHGTAKFIRMTWKRPRWPKKVQEFTEIEMDRGHGLPHAGKGENSWDCGDDALCGWSVSGFDVQAAIADGIKTVEKRRRRYGMPSALSASNISRCQSLH